MQTGERQEETLGTALVAKTGEMAAIAGAARAKAQIEAAYLVAINRPRDIDKAEKQILQACQDPTFADSAMWNRIVGREKNEATGQWEDVWGEGLNIRFAEEAVQAMTNIHPSSDLVYEDEDTKVFKITITDLEANVAYSKDVTIKKTIERQKLNRGQVAISERTNSRGQIVYVVAATEMDMRNKQAAAESLVMRTNGLRLIPARIKAKAIEQIKATILANEKASPGVIGRLLKSFEEFGATKEQIDKLLHHDLAQVTGEEIVKLRGLYRAIKDGETTWQETINAAVEIRPEPEKASVSLDDVQEGKVETHTEPGESQTGTEPKPGNWKEVRDLFTKNCEAKEMDEETTQAAWQRMRTKFNFSEWEELQTEEECKAVKAYIHKFIPVKK